MSSLSAGTYEGGANIKNGVLRGMFAAVAILLELLFLLAVFLRFNTYASWIHFITRVLSVLLVLGIYSQHRTATIRMSWIVLILAAPVTGLALYLMIGLNGSTRKMRRRFEEIDSLLLPLLPAKVEIQHRLWDAVPAFANISCYLQRYAGYPVYENTRVDYYSDALDGLEAQLKDLKTARHFIFMEYHAIEEKEAFQRILDILTDKVKEGVEVRLFYDDIGSLSFINTDFVKRMEALGIRCRVFNPVGPWLNLFLNNRDHRKITVIDGRVGFTGGYNLANEYFHLTAPFGYWKDTGVRLEGDAVQSLTVTFLEMWNAVSATDVDDQTFDQYLPAPFCPEERKEEGAENAAASFVHPYADTPLDDEQVGEIVYASMANCARHYVWYITPYLILTDEMSYTLSLAAKRGVDVRIITPGIPDKPLIYSITRSYYAGLARNGVRIFEFTPGFCHAKMCVADDEAATCGTINLDFRSLYHHFENGCLLYGGPAVAAVKKDFDDTLLQCTEVTEQYRTGRSRMLRLGQLILRLFSPLA